MLLVAAGLLAACQSVPSVASLVPAAAGPLVTITTRGGECMNGPCGATIAIGRDGSVAQTEPASADLGTVPAEILAGLDAAIKTTDFDAVRARPFPGECPVNFDGQEVIFEFGAPGGVERIASCETQIDPDQPVFAATVAAVTAVGGFVPLPVP